MPPSIRHRSLCVKIYIFSAVVVAVVVVITAVVVDAKKVDELCRLKPFAEFQSPDERNFCMTRSNRFPSRLSLVDLCALGNILSLGVERVPLVCLFGRKVRER